MKNLTLAALAMAAVLTLITGCASPTPAEPAASVKQVHTLWKVPTNLVGDPQVVDGTIVSYIRVKQQLRVAAWRLSDGHQLWSAAAETSATTPGVELSVDTVSVGDTSYVAYLTKKKGETWRRLVVADVRTGPRNGAAPMVVWPSSSPSACTDGKAFCMQGYREFAPNKQVNLRINPLAPALTTDHADGVPANSRSIGNQIFATHARAPKGVEKLGRMVNDKVLWQRPYAEVFGKGASSDHGWEWLDEHDGIIVGMGTPQRCKATHKSGKWVMTCDATRARMVGLNQNTGETVWSVDGFDYCPTAARMETPTGDRIIACVNKVAKTIYGAKKNQWTLRSRVRHTELVAIGQQTGEILWRTDLGTETGEGSDNYFVTSPDRMAMTVNGKTSVYDLATGAATPADATTSLMCLRDRPELKLHWLNDKKRTSYTIGDDVEPCDQNGKAIKQIPADWVPAAGIDAGENRWLLPTPGSMTLVELT